MNKYVKASALAKEDNMTTLSMFFFDFLIEIVLSILLVLRKCGKLLSSCVEIIVISSSFGCTNLSVLC